MTKNKYKELKDKLYACPLAVDVLVVDVLFF